MASIKFVKRARGELIRCNQNKNSSTLAFDVSSYAPPPFCHLSPFTYDTQFNIPVPGMDATYAHSVEGIWQGLKVIDGKTDEHLFVQKPNEREGNVQGHLFKRRVLTIQEAREKIYIPAYTFFLETCASKETIAHILEHQRSGKNIFLYDIENNCNIQDPAPLAYSAVLAAYVNFKVARMKFEPRNEAETMLETILAGQETLEEKAAITRQFMMRESIIDREIDREFKKAFQYRCVEHPQTIDDFHIAEALTPVLKHTN